MEFNKYTMIKFIFFDWGSTLGKKHTRKVFIENPDVSVKKAQLADGSIELLRKLKSRGIRLGIISNMRSPPGPMNQALKRIGIYDLFDVIVYSSSVNMCKKPCTLIFEKAFELARRKVPTLRYENIAYVGNDYKKDMVPIYENFRGMHMIHIKNDKSHVPRTKRCRNGGYMISSPSIRSLIRLLKLG